MGMLINVPVTTDDGHTIVFQMEDPRGDDYGPGTYTYPQNTMFQPYEGLFDLLEFTVFYDHSNVYFDLKFAEVTNPLDAPEGFGNVLMDIYMHTGSTEGTTSTFRDGANIRFSSDYPWQYYVRAGPWRMSSFYAFTDDPKGQGLPDAVSAFLLPDEKTIRIVVDGDVLENPNEEWKYYVLIGAQDGYGPDEYKLVQLEASQWEFGGAEAPAIAPRVIDLLAPETGPHTQEKMLSSYDVESSSPATIYPVPIKPHGYLLVAAIVACLLFIIIIGLVVFRVFKNRVYQQ